MAATKAVLIIGGSGFLGTHLAIRLRNEYKVYATYFTRQVSIPGVSVWPVSLANRNWLKRVAYTVRPEVIIYAAGTNRVDIAEKSAQAAESIHSAGPASILNVAEIFQPKFIYLSNCYVFDGNRGNYREGDTVLPSTALGKAKVAGENFIRGKSLNYTILRSTPILGRSNGLNLSFLDQLRMKLDRGERIELPENEIHGFVAIQDFAEVVARLVASGPKNKILHYGGLTKCSFFDLGRAFAKRFGYDPNLVVQKSGDGTISDYSLNFSQAIETLKLKPLLLEESLDLIEKNLVVGS